MISNLLLALNSTLPGNETLAVFIFSMASSSDNSDTKANLLGKRNLEDDLEIEQDNSEEKRNELLDKKSDQEAYIRRRKRSVFVGSLSCDTEISDIIDFFKDVGELVHVRLIVDHRRRHKGCGYVVFASSKGAKKALQNKNGEYLHGHKVFLAMAKKDPYIPRDKYYCRHDKVWYKDDNLGAESLLIEEEEDETMEELDETPYSVEETVIRVKTLYVDNLPPQIKISDIIDFFKNVGQVVRVQLTVNQLCEPKRGFVEFASSNEANKALQKKGEFLDGSKIFLAVAKKNQRPKFSIDHKVWSGHYLRQQCLPIEEDPSDFVEDVLFVANLSPQTKLLNVINFFNNVGVVSVRLIVNHEGKHVGYGFVQFASSNDAKKALEENNGEYMLDHKIFLDVVKPAPYPPRPKSNLAEMLCYDDYLRRESLLIEDDETPNCVEAVAIRKKTLFVSHLSCHTKISHIIKFFKDVGKVVHVRLIVNHLGKHMGDGFVEFASANEAKKALEKKNGEYLQDCKIWLEMARTDPHLPPPKYCIDHKVWYEDYLRRENLLIEEDEAVEGLDETPDYVEEVAIVKKTLFVAILPRIITITNIIDFFKDVGQVCRFRLIVNHMNEHVGCGFVEFASAKEAKKVLRFKNGEKLCGRNIFLYEVEMAPYPIRPKYNLAEMCWYKDYLRRESVLSLLIEEEEDDDDDDDDDLEIKQNVKKQKVSKLPIFCGTKITFSDED